MNGIDWSVSIRDVAQALLYAGTLAWGIYKYGRISATHEANLKASMNQVLLLHQANTVRLDALEKGHHELGKAQTSGDATMREHLDEQVDIVRERIHSMAETANAARLELAKVEVRSTMTEQRLDRIDRALVLLNEKSDRLLNRKPE